MNVAAIIPAYNEEATIGDVVMVAAAHRSIGTVIVVDDGSRDRTAKRAQAAGARVLQHRSNKGKAQAMETATRACPHASHFLFMDADILGLTKEHINALMKPVNNGAAMSIGIRDRGALLTALNVYVLPWISGERVVAKTLWEAVPAEFKHGYKIELGLNATARWHQQQIVPIVLRGLTIRRKEQKVGMMQGLRERAAMTAELVAAMLEIMLH